MQLFQRFGLLLLFAGTVLAQTLPSKLPCTVYGAGLGYRSMESPRTSGWLSVGHCAGDRVWALLVTDHNGSSSSERADVEILVGSWRKFFLLGKAGAGVATGLNAQGNTNIGGSFAGGGTLAFDISKWAKREHVYAVASYTVVHSNVNEPVAVGFKNIFQSFGNQGVFRFGIVFGN